MKHKEIKNKRGVTQCRHAEFISANIGQVKPGASRKQAEKLSGLRPTYKCCQGFTLIELLVSVLIIGILVAVALPQYNKAVKKAQGREVYVLIDILDKTIPAYYLEHGTYAGITENTLNVQLPKSKYFKYQHVSNGPSTYESTFAAFTAYGVYCSIGLVGPENNTPQVTLYWQENKQSEFYCVGSEKCDQYFNCNWKNIEIAQGQSLHRCYLK